MAFLTDEELVGLMAAYKDRGDMDARAAILADAWERFRPLAAKICKQRFGGDEWAVDDLHQEVAILAATALDIYDVDGGRSFRSFLYQRILWRLPPVGTVAISRMPVGQNVAVRLDEFHRKRAKLRRAGLPHSDDDVFDALGWVGEEVRDGFRMLLASRKRSSWMPQENLKSLVDRGDEDGGPPSPASAKVARLLLLLTEKQAAVFRMHYGIGGAAMTVTEIARHLGISTPGVMSFLDRGMDKIRLREGAAA